MDGHSIGLSILKTRNYYLAVIVFIGSPEVVKGEDDVGFAKADKQVFAKENI